MAIAYRTNGTSSQTFASGVTSISLSKPSGVQENDIMLAVLNLESSAPSGTPSGWALVTSVNQDTVSLRNYVYWKRAGASESGPYVWTCSSQYAGGAMSTYSGVTTSGNPWEGTPSTNQGGLTTTATFSSVTTSSTDAMLVAFCVNYNTGTRYSAWSSPITNERVDVDCQVISDGIQASPGSSGSKTATMSASEYFCAIMLALTPAGSGGLTASPSDTTTATDAITGVTGAYSPATRFESVTATDAVTGVTGAYSPATISDTVTLAEAIDTRVGIQAALLADTVTATDAVLAVSGAYAPATIADLVTLAEAVTVSGAYAPDLIAEAVTATDVVINAGTSEGLGPPLLAFVIDPQLS